MPVKKPSQATDKTGSQQASQQPAANDPDPLAQLQAHLAAMVPRVKQAPQALVAPDVLHLQRIVGNRTVERLLADRLQRQARGGDPQGRVGRKPVSAADRLVQRTVFTSMAAMWAEVEPGRSQADIESIIERDTALVQAYTDVASCLGNMDFIYENGRQPEAATAPQQEDGDVYAINYGRRSELRGTYKDITRYVGAILHEMMHITAAVQFATNTPAGEGVGHIANMNLPVPEGKVKSSDRLFGLTDNQFSDPDLGALAQVEIMAANWDRLSAEAQLDVQHNALAEAHLAVINERIDYAKQMPGMLAHYDTVLFDLLYYLNDEGVARSRAYTYAHDMLTEANERRLTKRGAVREIPQQPLPAPKPAGKKKKCFITTACVRARGLPDDCEELSVLRAFRDGYVLRRHGKGLVDLYYTYSPGIVAAIDRRPDAGRIYDDLYGVIRRCVRHIRNQEYEIAFEIYVEMVLGLSAAYAPGMASKRLQAGKRKAASLIGDNPIRTRPQD